MVITTGRRAPAVRPDTGNNGMVRLSDPNNQFKPLICINKKTFANNSHPQMYPNFDRMQPDFIGLARFKSTLHEYRHACSTV